jgi:hypothetical protein
MTQTLSAYPARGLCVVKGPLKYFERVLFVGNIQRKACLQSSLSNESLGWSWGIIGANDDFRKY